MTRQGGKRDPLAMEDTINPALASYVITAEGVFAPFGGSILEVVRE
jgi:hypothetical protein